MMPFWSTPGRADTQFNRGLVAMVLGEPYKDYLNQARQLDLDYYTKSEKRIAEIEKTLQATQKPQNDDFHGRRN